MTDITEKYSSLLSPSDIFCSSVPSLEMCLSSDDFIISDFSEPNHELFQHGCEITQDYKAGRPQLAWEGKGLSCGSPIPQTLHYQTIKTASLTPLNQIIPDPIFDPIEVDSVSVDDSKNMVHHVLTPCGEISTDTKLTRLKRIFSLEQHNDGDNEMVEILRETKQRVMEFLEQSVSNWSHYFFTLKHLGELIMFDDLWVNTGGSSPDLLNCFLFEDRLILLEDFRFLVGQIMIREDIVSVNEIGGIVSLNLRNESIMELQLHHRSEIVVSKWSQVWKHYQTGIPVNVSNLHQLSATSWESLSEAGFEVASEMKEYSKRVNLDETLSSSLMSLATYRTTHPNLNLIMSVPLVNQTNLSDEEYKSQLIKIIQATRATLRPSDCLGLIFVGKDSEGNFARSGSFIACIESNWDGWDKLFEDMQIFRNAKFSLRRRDLAPVFCDDLQELLVTIEKCVDMFPFICNTTRYVNKLVILNSNDIGSSLQKEASDRIKSRLTKMVKSINDKVEITMIRIGPTTTAVDYLHSQLIQLDQRTAVESRPIVSDRMGSEPKIILLEKFDELCELLERVDESQ